MRTKFTLALLTLGASAGMAFAQDSGGGAPADSPPSPGQQAPGGPGRHRHHRPPPPLIIGALDANHDHVIDATEIANASAALQALDKNGDGQLTIDEYMGPKPPDAPNDGRKPPLPSVVQALDANHDGIIDASEIANAPAVLKALDKNGDGQLTPDEFCGPRTPPPEGSDFQPQDPPPGN